MKNWRNSLIPPTHTIRQTIQTIDQSSLQIALVVDSHDRLMGTVTDGDIRRGILRGISFDETVDKVMRSNPVVLKENEDKRQILAVMKQKHIHQVPVLNELGQVISIEVLDKLLKSHPRNNWVVIMAGGMGSRLMPMTENLPKPLIPVGKKPILETILENFLEYGFRKFFFAVNYKEHLIKEYFGDGSQWDSEIHYLTESERLGTAGALSLLGDVPRKPFFVMNGDLLTKVNFAQLLQFHYENKVSATMCVREYDFQVPYGVVKLNGHLIQQIDEKPVHRFFVNAGIYVLEPEILSEIPKATNYDMPQLFDHLMAKGKKTGAFPIREYWIDIGRLNDLERAKDDFSEMFT